jgi:hypothetical protein
LVGTIPDFWLTLPLLPWAEELYAATQGYQPRVLTGCPHSGYAVAVAQKTALFARHFPGLPVLTCRSRDKASYLTAPGDVLLDDTQRNVQRWNKAGGRAILFRTCTQAITDLRAVFAG